MANKYVNFNAPSPYASQQADLERRQRLAELMQQQAMQPIETNNTSITPTQGLAKVLQSYLSAKQLDKINKEQKRFDINQELESARVDRAGDLLAGSVYSGRKPLTVKETTPDENGLAMVRGPLDPVRLGSDKYGRAALGEDPALLEAYKKAITPKPSNVAGIDVMGLVPSVRNIVQKAQLEGIDVDQSTLMTLAQQNKNEELRLSKERNEASARSDNIQLERLNLAQIQNQNQFQQLAYALGIPMTPSNGGGASSSPRSNTPPPKPQAKPDVKSKTLTPTATPATVVNQNPLTDSSKPFNPMAMPITDIAGRKDYSEKTLQNQTIVDSFQNLRNIISANPKTDLLFGENAGKLSNAYIDSINQVRKLAATGVLNVSEFPFLEKALKDPTSLKYFLDPTSKAFLLGQLEQSLIKVGKNQNNLNKQFNLNPDQQTQLIFTPYKRKERVTVERIP